MYWYYKFILVIVLLVLVGLGLYSFRAEIAGLFPKDPEPIPVKVVQPVTPTPPVIVKVDPVVEPIKLDEEEWAETLAKATELSEKGLLDKSNLLALTVLEDPALDQFSPTWYDAADLIGKNNTILATTSAPSKRKTTHIVKAGDSLAKIAKGKTTVRNLQRSNNIPLDIATIYPNQVLHYLAGPWEIQAYKSEFILLLLLEGKFFKYYKVGIGKANRTPEAEFVIQTKEMNPTWQKPGAELIPYGHPDNPLGTRWMRIVSEKHPEHQGFGIHGTSEPKSIGTASSQGCLRLRNEEVEELFDIIPYRVKVTIRE